MIEGSLKKIKAEGDSFVDRYVYVTHTEVKYYKSEWAASLWGNRPINTTRLSRISHAKINAENPTNFEVFRKADRASPVKGPVNVSYLLAKVASKLKNIVEKNHLMLMPIAAVERVSNGVGKTQKKGWRR